RPDHHRADPARAARRQVPPPLGLASAARQHPDLRPGRGDCSVHRHQVDRSPPRSAEAGLKDDKDGKDSKDDIMRQLGTALLIFIILTLLTGLLYPLLVTGIAQLVFPRQANGSLIERDGKVIGSELIGQAAFGPRYFWSRPS